MNFLKRAGRSLLYYKRNTLLMFGIFLILSTLILSGLCIRSAREQSTEQIRRSIGATVTISNNMSSSYEVRGKNTISLERALEISEFSEVNAFNYSVVSSGYPVSFESYKSEAQKKEYPDEIEMSISGDTDSDENENFATAMVTVIQGRTIEAQDKYAAVVNDTLAEINDWELGDAAVVKSPYTGSEVELEIVGIYSLTEAQAPTGHPFNNPENQIYVDAGTALELNDESRIRRAVYSIDDPVEASVFVEKAKALPEVFSEEKEIIYAVNNSEYRNVSGALNSIMGITVAMVTASMVMGAIILTLLVIMAMKERDFEIGILLSMGECKWKIIAQMILEVLVPVMLAVTASVFISGWVAQSIGTLLGGENIKVTIERAPVIIMYLCGLGLTLLASSVSIWKIMRYRPKKILMAIE
jgi:putative ABC transport system permease protein